MEGQLNALRDGRDKADSQEPYDYAEGAVLVVEDNPLVAQFVEEILKSIGKTVYVARNGQEAVDIFAHNRETLVLVILDYSIPGMHASQLVTRFKALNNGVKVIVSSGYQEQEIFCELSYDDVDGFISKPFEVSSFIRLLNRTLPN